MPESSLFDNCLDVVDGISCTHSELLRFAETDMVCSEVLEVDFSVRKGNVSMKNFTNQ
jgi:hypothetical protein